MKALILVADGFEDLHLFCPWYRLREEGADVTLASPSGKPVTGRRGYAAACHLAIHNANPADYDLLVIPGGYSPEKLRLREEAVDIARTFMDEGRQVAIIGHAAQLLISAGAISGRHVAAAPEIRDDIRAAGGAWHDEGTVTDGNLVSCRGNDDLPELCRALAACGAAA
ncbi:MAG: type 1 glutamine amidotransferase [Gemmataceae bacterium]|nr:type 1 glutamine amidotransferase [Gemmataceae bacterium]